MVTFNQVPANMRAPLFIAEINAGQSPYQGPSRLLIIGQRTSAGSMAANTIARLDGDAQALAGAGSMLAEMALWARQNHPFGEIWLGALADTGTAAVKTITIASGIEGKAGIIVVYLAGERIEVTVAPTDTDDNIATALAAAINAGYTKFERSLSFPVTAAASTNTVVLTARNQGALGSKIAIDFNLVGDEGALQQYLSVADTTAGAGTPGLGTLLAAVGDIEFDWIAAPYADTTSLDTMKTFLDGTSGRWSPLQQVYGHYLTAMFDTYSNLAAAGAGRNDPNASIMGVPNSPSPPWRWAAAYGAQVARDKNLGAEVDQAYRLSQPLHTIELVGIKAPKSRTDWFSKTQRNNLYQDGISSFTVQVDGTVQIDRIITTYQTNGFGQPDITWLGVETRAQTVYVTRYLRQRITQVYGRMALADDGMEGRPGVVTPKMLKAEIIHAYKELEQGGLVENSELFAKSLEVVRSSDPNRVNAYLPIDVVNQFIVFAANITTHLQYAA